MGDRTNLVISYKSTAAAENLAGVLAGALVLYSHWGGYDMGPTLAGALTAAKGRWDDDGYCARILVSRVVGSEWERETGFGLYAGELGDNEHAVLVVDIPRKLVRRFGNPAAYLSPEKAGEAKPTAEWPFHEFISMNETEARAAHIGGKV